MPSELAELLHAAEETRRTAHAVPVPVASQGRPWFRMERKADKPKTAEVWIYDTIGESWFGDSTTAKTFTAQLRELDVDEITLHLNSPGGDYFDGVAIYNALVDHPATVHAVVDGLAASAASFIFQAGDTRKVNRAGQVMIHDASGIVIGNAADMADMVDLLDKVSNSIAGIYASRSGGTAEDWRTAMRAETWYTAAEAVDAGLADESVDETPSDPPVRNTFDLAIFNYAGRDKAPPPTSTPPAPPGKPRERSTPVANELTDEQLAELRKKAGVADDASLEDTLAALHKAPEPDASPTDKAGTGGLPDGDLPARAIVVDRGAWEDREARIKQLEAQANKQRVAERDDHIAQAIKDGKFSLDARGDYERLWDNDPEGTRRVIDRMPKNSIPVAEMGHAGPGAEDFDAELAEFEATLPPESRTIGKGR